MAFRDRAGRQRHAAPLWCALATGRGCERGGDVTAKIGEGGMGEVYRQETPSSTGTWVLPPSTVAVQSLTYLHARVWAVI